MVVIIYHSYHCESCNQVGWVRRKEGIPQCAWCGCKVCDNCSKGTLCVSCFSRLSPEDKRKIASARATSSLLFGIFPVISLLVAFLCWSVSSLYEFGIFFLIPLVIGYFAKPIENSFYRGILKETQSTLSSQYLMQENEGRKKPLTPAELTAIGRERAKIQQRPRRKPSLTVQTGQLGSLIILFGTLGVSYLVQKYKFPTSGWLYWLIIAAIVGMEFVLIRAWENFRINSWQEQLIKTQIKRNTEVEDNSNSPDKFQVWDENTNINTLKPEEPEQVCSNCGQRFLVTESTCPLCGKLVEKK